MLVGEETALYLIWIVRTLDTDVQPEVLYY